MMPEPLDHPCTLLLMLASAPCVAIPGVSVLPSSVMSGPPFPLVRALVRSVTRLPQGIQSTTTLVFLYWGNCVWNCATTSFIQVTWEGTDEPIRHTVSFAGAAAAAAAVPPPHDPKDAKGVDETTDALDTVEWLVKNVANNNGRAGIAGTSYDGWTAVMAALNPHPALKAAIEQASPADQFLGDDFHHNGAFRLSYGFEYSAMLETSATENYRFPFDRADTYDWYLGLGALANADEKYFHGKVPTWTDFTRHPNYDTFWQRQAFAPYLNAVKLPMIHVAGWWDQEDFYGPQKIYELMERHDAEGRNYFVAGPWNHGGWNGNGRKLGAIDFGSDTAAYYREKIFEPWFDHWLRGQAEWKLAEATVLETGANEWQEHEAWPPKRGVETRRLYFREGRRLAFDGPGGSGGFDEYVSDPANPVPYRPRPVPPTYPGPAWRVWLVE